MKKVININFQGRVIPIEETSYDLLKQYIDSLRIYFANEEGRDEIVNDIESRICELFQERLKAGATCITDEDINVIINSIGRPQDLADAESATRENSSASNHQSAGNNYEQSAFVKNKRLYRDANNKILGGVCSGIAAYFNVEPIIIRLIFIFSGIGFFAYILLWAFVPSSTSVQNGVRKRLYRSADNKIIAGVCSGIASYFNINVWIPRILFLLPFISILFRWGHFGPLSFPHFINFTFSPTTVLIYIILWLVIPEALTTSEKLEMKGEKVDINTIKNSVKEEMKGVKERVEKLGKEGREIGKNLGSEMGAAARRGGKSLGDIIVILLKLFLYFILAVFAFTSFGIAIAATGIFPFKDYIIKEGWQNAFAWGSLLFFIYVPVIAVITWIIRRIARIKSNSSLMKWGFSILWTLGWVCFIFLIASVSKDFRSLNTVNEESVVLANPTINMLHIKSSSVGKYNRFRFEPFASVVEDTAYVNNVGVRIIKSPTDSFQVTITKFVNGRTRRYADTLAALIKFNIEQKDSALLLDRGIPITEQDKFRNQRVVITVAVPVGKRIKVDKTFIGWNVEHFQFPWSDEGEFDFGNESYSWWGHDGEELVMKEDGLYTLDGKPANESTNRRKKFFNKNGRTIIINEDENDWNENEETKNNSYRYDRTQNTIDSLKAVKNKEIQKVRDSLLKQKQEIERNLENIKKTSRANDEASKSDIRNYDFVLNI